MDQSIIQVKSKKVKEIKEKPVMVKQPSTNKWIVYFNNKRKEEQYKGLSLKEAMKVIAVEYKKDKVKKEE